MAGYMVFPDLSRTGAAVRGATPDDERLRRLSDKEVVILQMLAKGLTNKSIGEALFISNKTVSSHKARIMVKLQATSRSSWSTSRGAARSPPDAGAAVRAAAGTHSGNLISSCKAQACKRRAAGTLRPRSRRGRGVLRGRVSWVICRACWKAMG